MIESWSAEADALAGVSAKPLADTAAPSTVAHHNRRALIPARTLLGRLSCEGPDQRTVIETVRLGTCTPPAGDGSTAGYVYTNLTVPLEGNVTRVSK